MFLLSLIIGALSGFFAMFPFLIIFHFTMLRRNKDIKKAIPHFVATYVFSFFIAAVLSTTGVPSLLYLRIAVNINVIPFRDISSNFVQYVENIILFIPIGFLLPVLWKRFERLSITIIAGALLSLLIEISQMLCYRATDVDDLIMNTLGALVGFCIYRGIKKVFPKIGIIFNDLNVAFLKWEAEIYIAFAWLAMFFIEPFISQWIWSLILK